MVLFVLLYSLALGWVAGGLVCSDFWSFHKDSQKVCSMDWDLM